MNQVFQCLKFLPHEWWLSYIIFSCCNFNLFLLVLTSVITKNIIDYSSLELLFCLRRQPKLLPFFFRYSVLHGRSLEPVGPHLPWTAVFRKRQKYQKFFISYRFCNSMTCLSHVLLVIYSKLQIFCTAFLFVLQIIQANFRTLFLFVLLFYIF